LRVIFQCDGKVALGAHFSLSDQLVEAGQEPMGNV